MKHKHSSTAPYLFLCTMFLTPYLWRGIGGEAFAQQLSPRYILTKPVIVYPNTTIPPKQDSTRTFGLAVPTNIKGGMVGVANTEIPDPLVNIVLVKPHIYRLDSTGKYTDLINFKITTTYDYSAFEHVVPFKDSLYINGRYRNVENQYWNDCKVFDQLILKTDLNGNVSWKKTWGDYNICEAITDEVLCSDGGIAFVGKREGLYLPDLNRGVGMYRSTKHSMIKLNADGTVQFNKSYQIPDSLNIAEGIMTDPIITETPDKGYLMVAIAEVPINKSYGLLLLKVDANGNKLWHKGIVENQRLFGFCTISDIIPHPAGGYVLVGTANANGSHNDEFPTFGHGIILKISEVGDIEWIKKIYSPLENEITFNQLTLTTANAADSGFIIGGMISDFQESQTLIVKIDLDGALLWTREYGAFFEPLGFPFYPFNNQKIYEESGGSLLVNTLASPFAENLPPIPDANGNLEPNPLNDKGILRLNDKGYLNDPVCSLSPRLLIENNNNPLDYYTNDFIFETTTTPIGNLGGVTISHNRVPITTIGVCGNPLLADFQYQIFCSDTGTGATVNFSNNSRGGSWFQYNFGDPASTNNVSDSANPQHVYSSYGTYTVSLTTWDGDSSKNDITNKVIEIKAPRYIAILPGSTTICTGTTVNLTATISSGTFPTGFFQEENASGTYNNATTDTTTGILASTPSVPLNKTRFYILTFDNCVFTDTVVVTVLPTVNISVTGDTLLCAGDSSLLIASGSTTYWWYPGNSTTDSLLVYPSTTTTYTVSSGLTNVCGTNTDQLTVTIYSLPTIDAGGNRTIDSGAEIQLVASGGMDYVWMPATTLTNSTISNPLAMPDTTTTYTVMATDVNGCTGSDTVTVFIKPPCSGGSVFVATAFSPNGDDTNELECALSSGCIQTFSFSIYDRWGNQVFKADDSNTCWDGTYQGKPMSSGVFVYYLQAILTNGNVMNQKGNISLIK